MLRWLQAPGRRDLWIIDVGCDAATRFQERAWMGWTLMALARKRQSR